MAARTGARPVDGEVGSVNQVLLVGRLSGEPTVRALPSGDVLTSWRLVVDRTGVPAAASGIRAPTVDTIDCVAHKRSVQRLATRWVSGDVLEVRGVLRRRFWRGAQGAASRCEVEVTEAKRATIPVRGPKA
jgi:single-strand DNA-binding protein